MTIRGAYIRGGAYYRHIFIVLQVDGPITGRAYKQGAYKRQFMYGIYIYIYI